MNARTRTADTDAASDASHRVPDGAPRPARDAVDTEGGCTCFHVRRLARRVTQRYDRALAPSGLRVTQFSLLSQLARIGATAIGPLADRLDMDRTTLTRNLRPLLDSRLVVLVPAESDARVRMVALTADGRARLREARRLWRRTQDDVDATLGRSRVAALHRLFDDLVETFNDHGTGRREPA